MTDGSHQQEYRSPSDAMVLHVNGRTYQVAIGPAVPLLFALRNDLGLNGPKYGCGLGQCGACSVLVDGVSVRSCVIPMSRATQRSIVTLEGLGSTSGMHVVQAAFVKENAAQCGYCLNGMIIAAVALLRRNRTPSDTEIKEALRYHLCRCGAHMEILAAVRRASCALNADHFRQGGSSHD